MKQYHKDFDTKKFFKDTKRILKAFMAHYSYSTTPWALRFTEPRDATGYRTKAWYLDEKSAYKLRNYINKYSQTLFAKYERYESWYGPKHNVIITPVNFRRDYILQDTIKATKDTCINTTVKPISKKDIKEATTHDLNVLLLQIKKLSAEDKLTIVKELLK